MHWCFFRNPVGSTIQWISHMQDVFGLEVFVCCHVITMLLLHMLMSDHDKVLISNDVDQVGC